MKNPFDSIKEPMPTHKNRPKRIAAPTTASEYYRKFYSDYRGDRNDGSGEPISDGDLLDWIMLKFERKEFIEK